MKRWMFRAQGSPKRSIFRSHARPRALRLAIVAVLAAAALIVGGGIVGRMPATSPATPSTDAQAPVDRLGQSISRSQDQLRRVPGDWRTWAALGMSYLELARITSDPTYYPKAEEAVRRSLDTGPEDNQEALVAQGALANARHDFAGARSYALAATSLNEFNADAFAVLADAETHLGHPTEATTAIQRMLDLRPGLSAYARASYDLELRGQTEQASDLMRRALASAIDRHDIAFCRVQLGDLALTTGRLASARSEYEAALAAEPTSVAAQRGLARSAWMSGRLDDAIERYAVLTGRAPLPGYLLEHAELLRAAGRLDEAQVQLHLATTAHELFAASGGTDGLTGAALAEASGRPDEALRAAESEWSRRQHADVADALAWALHLSDRDSEARTYAERAVTSGARSATYHFHLGMIEFALGDRDAARMHLATALEINPTFSLLDAPTARRALADLGSS